MISFFFAEGEIANYQDVQKSDTDKYGEFFRFMLNKGILLPPAQFEGLFVNTAITDEELEYTIICHKEALKAIHNI